jgi:membrane-associated protein
MSVLHTAADWVLHLDRHLTWLLMHYGRWLYGIVFGVIFMETGVVIMPFLPGDSLLFGMGALAAVDQSGTLQIGWLFVLLVAAAVAGNSLNYSLGRALGESALSGQYRLIRVEHLRRTEEYFHRFGGATVLLSRFVPIIRTCAPFVAGIGRMSAARFQLYNFAGAGGWVALFLLGGFGFGNLPWVRANFGFVTLTVIAVSMLPLLGLVARSTRTNYPSKPEQAK